MRNKKFSLLLLTLSLMNFGFMDSAFSQESMTEVVVLEQTKVEKIVSLNQATKEDLMGIKGIGPVLAERILNYRNEKGNFDSVEELQNVFGVGESKFNTVKASLTV